MQQAPQEGLMVRNLPISAEDIRDVGLILGLGRFPGVGHGNPLQHSCLEKPGRLQCIGEQSWTQPTEHACTHSGKTIYLGFTVSQHVKVKVCDPMDYRVHGILQVRILEWVPFPFSRGSPQPRDQTQVSGIAGRFFTS